MERLDQRPANAYTPVESRPVSASGRLELLAELVVNAKETYNPLDPGWLQRAECYMAGIAASNFFETEDGHWLAKEACGRCEIAGPCLKYALDNGEKDGIWGGTDATERRAVKARLVRRRPSAA